MWKKSGEKKRKRKQRAAGDNNIDSGGCAQKRNEKNSIVSHQKRVTYIFLRPLLVEESLKILI